MATDDNKTIHEKYWCNLRNLVDLGLFFVKDINTQYGTIVVDEDDFELAKSLLHELEPKNALPNFEKFICSSYPHWKKILDKDREYFIENSHDILSAYTKIAADSFKQLFTTRSADDPDAYAIIGDDADEVWDYFIEFVRMAIRHIHRHREPTIHRKDDSNVSTTYDNPKYMENINIKEWAKIYNVNLMWV